MGAIVHAQFKETPHAIHAQNALTGISIVKILFPQATTRVARLKLQPECLRHQQHKMVDPLFDATESADSRI